MPKAKKKKIVDIKKVRVIKRGGKLEPFQPQKIIKACIAAGVDEKTAREIARRISRRVHDRIPAGVIRDLVVGMLEIKNPEWAENWRRYEEEHGKSP
jgi:transcriptional regulator NrdR family protein